MSALLEKQQLFAVMVADLINHANSLGYALTFGEAYRTPEQAALNAAKGTGIKNSLHTDRLAIDFNLFKDAKWLQQTEDFEPLGVFWESIGGTWGGRFGDGNHFSMEHQGRK